MQDSYLINIPKTHFFLSSCADIDYILAPLKKFNIHMFSFLRNYLDGSQVYLSNDQQWIKDYYEHRLFETSLFEHHPNQYQTGFIAWPAEASSKVFLHGKNYFNSYYGVTYCEKYPDFCEFYFLSGANIPHLQSFFLNDKEIIHHFILYFKDRAHELIKKATRHKIFIPAGHNSICNIEEDKKLINGLSNLEELKAAFFSESKIDNYYFQDNEDKIKKISPRQLQFIIHFLNHKTIPEIAHILNISTRTAESYFNNIKLKFNCETKSELIERLRKIGFRHEHFLS